jgi:hypothetical protein
MRAERIGVTGHRWNRLRRSEAGGIERAVRALFRELAQHGDQPRTLVSGMAEGTDLIAAACRPPDCALEAALPLPRAAWRGHLAAQPEVTGADLALFDSLMSEAAVVTLGTDVAAPDFGALADHLATSCDRLVALWDGTAGRPGGTGDVVRRARARGIDVRILDAGPFLIG